MIKGFPSSLVLLLTCVLKVAGQDANYKPVQYPEHYDAEIDLVYTEVNGWKGRLDLYTNPISEKPTPIVINIHGGGWNHGVKESQTGFGRFFEAGYAVANVAYRLVHIAPAPAPIRDVRCALIYIQKHSKEYNIDPNKIVIMGGSSGGHLALMAGLLGDNKKFDVNCTYDSKIKVAAIIDKYAPTDLTHIVKGSVKRWLGENHKNTTFVKSVSPINYVDKDSPPVFIVHGTDDPLIPYQQSLLLDKKLKSNNVKTTFVAIAGGGHGKFSKEKRLEINEKLWAFLKALGLTQD